MFHINSERDLATESVWMLLICGQYKYGWWLAHVIALSQPGPKACFRAICASLVTSWQNCKQLPIRSAWYLSLYKVPTHFNNRATTYSCHNCATLPPLAAIFPLELFQSSNSPSLCESFAHNTWAAEEGGVLDPWTHLVITKSVFLKFRHIRMYYGSADSECLLMIDDEECGMQICNWEDVCAEPYWIKIQLCTSFWAEFGLILYLIHYIWQS